MRVMAVLTTPALPPLVADATTFPPHWEACHMTQKVNPVTLLASPLGEEGHEVAKGWTVVRMIMIFLFYVLSP